MSIKIDKAFQNWIFGAFIALALYLVYVSRDVIPVLIISAIIAYILTPIVELLKKKLKFPHTLAVVVVFFINGWYFYLFFCAGCSVPCSGNSKICF